MQLLASMTSPYARKLRVLLIELGLAVDVVETMPIDDDAALVKANPLHKVPALVLDDGRSLIDSPVIAAYLLAQAPAQAVMPASGTVAYWRTRGFEALTDGILDAAIGLRIEASHDGAAGVSGTGAATQRNPLWPQRMRSAIDDTLAVLGDNHADIGHDSFGYADICAVVTLDYLSFRLPATDWRAQRALAALHDRHAGRPSLVATRPPA